ncbi:MAG: hypothetical protein R2851_20305 [Caldilineaceae bacterium]
MWTRHWPPPVCAAHDRGIPVHVWVDETRPRNQGARLTAWELGEHGVPTRSSPTTWAAISCNTAWWTWSSPARIARRTRATWPTRSAPISRRWRPDNDVPFYVALPSSTFDWQMRDGVAEIPIEQRDATEVRFMEWHAGNGDGSTATVRITPEHSPAANYAFDVTPARLVTGLITERGICAASEEGVLGLYPEKR